MACKLLENKDRDVHRILDVLLHGIRAALQHGEVTPESELWILRGLVCACRLANSRMLREASASELGAIHDLKLILQTISSLQLRICMRMLVWILAIMSCCGLRKFKCVLCSTVTVPINSEFRQDIIGDEELYDHLCNQLSNQPSSANWAARFSYPVHKTVKRRRD